MFARQLHGVARILNESSTATLAGLIFALAYLTRVGLVFLLRYYETDLDLDSEILHIASQFAKDFSFANPYICPTGATAHAPPAFPMLLGIIFRLFPPGAVREIVLCLAGSAVSSAAYALLPWLALNLGFHRLVGVIAGIFGAVVPLFFWIEARGIWDAPYTALFLILGVGVSAVARSGSADIARSFRGRDLGNCVLVRSVVVTGVSCVRRGSVLAQPAPNARSSGGCRVLRSRVYNRQPVDHPKLCSVPQRFLDAG